MSDRGLRLELERAITGNELVLHYQPRVLLTTLELRGVESLVRWRHPVRGMVSPAEFIAAAERDGLMRDLEAWVIRETLLQAAVWRRDGMRVGVSVNVTPPLLGDEPFLRLFERTLKIHGDPATFTFELAAEALAGGEPPLEGVTRLRDGGVRFALDDVTALVQLEDASWTSWEYVKLGRAIVTSAARDDVAGRTLRGLVARAIELGARVVGVGVEDDDAIAFLRDAGAYLAQGYAIAQFRGSLTDTIAPPLGVKDLAGWSDGRARTISPGAGTPERRRPA